MVSPLARADQDQDQPLVPPQSALEREKKHEATAVITHATSAAAKMEILNARSLYPRAGRRRDDSSFHWRTDGRIRRGLAFWDWGFMQRCMQ
jgi:hypothetical protein